MEDDETRTVSGDKGDPGPRQPWNTPYQGYVSSGTPTSPHGEETAYGYAGESWSQDPSRRPYQPQGSTPRSPKGRSNAWVLPIILVVLAAAAFGMVLFLLKGHDSKTPTAERSVAAQPNSPGGSPSTSSASTSELHDDFPADTGLDCTRDGNDSETSESDVRTVNGTKSSCDYVSQVKDKVMETLTNDPKSSTFTIQPFSAAKGYVVPLNCTRSNHLTHCTGGNDVDIYVKDLIQ